MTANWITLSRYPLLIANILILYYGSASLRMAGVALLFVGLMLDTVDGIVARRMGQTSLFGSVLDIAADRSYELALWVVFADLDMIPVAVPLIVIVRTTLTDGLRSMGVGQGTAPFAQHRTPIGRFLVGSPVMRTGYAASKVLAFCGLALVHALGGFGPDTPQGQAAPRLVELLRVVAWIAVAFCVFRGIPVIVRALRNQVGKELRVEG